MNRKLFLVLASAVLLLGACTASPTATAPGDSVRNTQSDTTTVNRGGTMGNGN